MCIEVFGIIISLVSILNLDCKKISLTPLWNKGLLMFIILTELSTFCI